MADCSNIDSIPTDWTVRPFVRYNTESEPEGPVSYPTDDESLDGELECLRCYPEDCYTNVKRSGFEHCGRGNSGGAAGRDAEGKIIHPATAVLGHFGATLQLLFFVTLPMIARQIGSIISRRLLTSLFGRPAPQ